MKKLLLKVNYQENDSLTDMIIEGDTADTLAQIETIINMASEDPSLLDDPEIKSMVDEYNATFLAQQQNPAPQNNQQSSQQNNQQQSSQEQATAHQVSEDDFVNKSLFFEEKNEISFDGITPESMADAIREHFNYDTTTPAWASKFLKDFNENKVTLSKLEKVKQQYDIVTEQLQEMPKPLLVGMQAALAGKNWREELKNFDIDYSVSFEKQPEEEQLRITQRLLPELIITEDKTKPEYKLALNLGKQAFDNHLKSIEQENTRMYELNQKYANSYKNSIDTSAKALGEAYPEFKDEDNVKELKEIADKKQIMSLFVDDKGLLKKDGLERLAYAIHGKTIISRISNVKASQKSNEKLANILGEQHSQGTGSKATNNITEQDQVVGKTEKLLNSYKQTY